MAVALLDSSAVVAYLDRGDALHLGAVEAVESAMRDGKRAAISAVTWAELLNGARQQHQDESVLRAFVDDFAIGILPVDATVAEAATDLQASHAAGGRRGHTRRLRTPDALILATALVHDEIEAIIGGDEQWAKIDAVAPLITLLRDT